MTDFIKALVLVTLAGACTEVSTTPDQSGPGTSVRISDEVASIAAPNQDLTAVRLLPEDNCYWYRYVGPVETTYLPLRTTEGRPICTKAS
ncbi:hypothetical protein [Ruegeria marina]|uniref:hypothetical protein n=1 Tax=Ruegeria marina TaxID=639004 RepID=UPI001FE0BE47|nr:hypothetical protein [Ruegeria marina]